jgi:predicted small secreted protein
MRFWFITPDGVDSDFASQRAERSASVVLGADTANEIIESVNKKDDHITVNTAWGQEIFADLAETGVTSGKFEYLLDAKTYEVISVLNDYSFNDGSAMQSVTMVSYDAEEPELVKDFLKYENETENLRNITVVSNPGTDKEVSQSFQIAKGLITGFRYEEEGYVFEVYTDAACTEAYDPYANTDSDETVYVKWIE